MPQRRLRRLIYNPAGYFGASPQGGAGAAASWGAGTDLINEDFTTDPLWPATGDASVTGGRAVFNLVTGGSDMFKPAITTQTELWMQWDFPFDSLIIPTAGQTMFGCGIQDENGNSLLNIGIKNSTGLKWNVAHRNDSGESFTTLSTPVWVVANTYNILMYHKSATAPAANDGIQRIWIDGDPTPVYESTTDDSDTKSSKWITVGSTNMSGSVVATIAADNVKVGTTGSAPV